MDLELYAAKETDLNRFYELTEHTEPNRRKRKPKMRLDLPRHNVGEKFIKGPIPLGWMRTASRCGYRSEAVALLLWYAAGWQKSNPVKLTPTILAEFQVSPKTARRTLDRFQST